MGFSLAQINRLKRDELIKVANLADSTPLMYQKQRTVDETTAIDDALRKIAKAGDDFVTMRDYAKALIKRFDNNNDGVITFQELCNGLRSFEIDLGLKERLALMRKLDVDKDGSITEVELARALNSVEVQLRNEAVNSCLSKIASGAENYPSMRHYVKDLVKKFDSNSDGLLTVQELTDGLRKLNIFLSQREKQSLISRLDINRDGEVSETEILKVLSTYSSSISKTFLNNSVD
jgi:Ca2+-binding EF-hand superfamily protein